MFMWIRLHFKPELHGASQGHPPPLCQVFWNVCLQCKIDPVCLLCSFTVSLSPSCEKKRVGGTIQSTRIKGMMEWSFFGLSVRLIRLWQSRVECGFSNLGITNTRESSRLYCSFFYSMFIQTSPHAGCLLWWLIRASWVTRRLVAFRSVDESKSFRFPDLKNSHVVLAFVLKPPPTSLIAVEMFMSTSGHIQLQPSMVTSSIEPRESVALATVHTHGTGFHRWGGIHASPSQQTWLVCFTQLSASLRVKQARNTP